MHCSGSGFTADFQADQGQESPILHLPHSSKDLQPTGKSKTKPKGVKTTETQLSLRVHLCGLGCEPLNMNSQPQFGTDTAHFPAAAINTTNKATCGRKSLSELMVPEG